MQNGIRRILTTQLKSQMQCIHVEPCTQYLEHVRCACVYSIFYIEHIKFMLNRLQNKFPQIPIYQQYIL